MAKAATKNKGGATKGRSKHRSPNYPLFDLGKAVELAQKLYEAEKTHKVPIGLAHERWGYKKHGGAGNQAVGALKSYGLISVEGTGNDRMLAVSDAARRIILESPDRAELLKGAAVGPSLFESLWDKYRDDGLPSDDVLKHHLLFERNFNEDVVDNVIERFKATVDFAGLAPGYTIAEPENDAPDEHGEGTARIASHLPAINRVNPPTQAIRNPPERKVLPGMKQDIYTLSAGDAVLQWPDRLTPDEYEELDGWLDLMKRKMKRSVVDEHIEEGVEILRKLNSAED